MTSEEPYGQEGLTQNDFVEKVLANRSDEETLTVFEGLLGESTTDGNWRLYFSSELDLCMDFNSCEWIETIPKDQTTLGFDLQKVWMTPDTHITVICRSNQDLNAGMKAELLAILQMPEIGRGHRHK